MRLLVEDVRSDRGELVVVGEDLGAGQLALVHLVAHVVDLAELPVERVELVVDLVGSAGQPALEPVEDGGHTLVRLGASGLQRLPGLPGAFHVGGGRRTLVHHRGQSDGRGSQQLVVVVGDGVLREGAVCQIAAHRQPHRDEGRYGHEDAPADAGFDAADSPLLCFLHCSP